MLSPAKYLGCISSALSFPLLPFYQLLDQCGQSFFVASHSTPFTPHFIYSKPLTPSFYQSCSPRSSSPWLWSSRRWPSLWRYVSALITDCDLKQRLINLIRTPKPPAATWLSGRPRAGMAKEAIKAIKTPIMQTTQIPEQTQQQTMELPTLPPQPLPPWPPPPPRTWPQLLPQPHLLLPPTRPHSTRPRPRRMRTPLRRTSRR